MHSQQLQIRILFGVLVALALIGLALLRSELQSHRKLGAPGKKQGRLLKFRSRKDRYRKAS